MIETTTSNWIDYDTFMGSPRHTATGNVLVLPEVYSPQLGNRRNLYIYLPPGYGTGLRRYPVLYMQDGQNLFDDVLSYAGEWYVDETLEALSAEGIEAIVVGVANAGEQRMDEYAPFRDPRSSQGLGAEYIAFLVDTVKPLIDSELLTLPDRENTGIIGSSLGALISLYGFFHRPDVFGMVGAMSPSIWFKRRAILPYIRKAQPAPGRIYLDVGAHEGPPAKMDSETGAVLARWMLLNTRELEKILRGKGYYLGHDFSYVEDPHGIHNEADWARRLPDALRFLLRHSPR